MSMPRILSPMIAQVAARLEDIERGLASSPDKTLLEPKRLATLAQDVEFVQDIAAVAPLFGAKGGEGLTPELAHALTSLADELLSSVNEDATVADKERQQWLQRYASQTEAIETPDKFLDFLHQTVFNHQGFPVSIAEYWTLTQQAPEAVTTEIRGDFAAEQDNFLDALATCLNDMFSQDERLFQQVMATSLKLDDAQVEQLLTAELPPAQTPGDTELKVFSSAEEMLEAARRHLIQSNISGEMCRNIFDAGHVIFGLPGPDFSFTLHPDVDKPPMVYVPFTGKARDVVLLCHQIGHALHLWSAARDAVFPVNLSPAIDEIIPSYFEENAFAILEEKLPIAAERARQEQIATWTTGVKEYRKLAELILAARRSCLSKTLLLECSGNIAALISGARFFPTLPLSSSAWGHFCRSTITHETFSLIPQLWDEKDVPEQGST